MTTVDQILNKYGFAWETSPYRIIDIKTKETAYEGLSFDLREQALKSMRKAFDNAHLPLHIHRFRKVSGHSIPTQN